jgi:hypothetical protein
MTDTHSLTTSDRSARSLLAAWDSGNVPSLRDELNRIAGTDYSSLSAFDHERIEIVQEIAQTIRVWLGGGRKKHADLNIALALLRHLATADDETRSYRIPPADFERAALTHQM